MKHMKENLVHLGIRYIDDGNFKAFRMEELKKRNKKKINDFFQILLIILNLWPMSAKYYIKIILKNYFIRF